MADFFNLLNADIQNYINANLKTDLHELLLKNSPFPEVTIQEIAQQIKGKNIAKKKFPFLVKENIIFPKHINLEQTSSQVTAIYKANLVKGKTFADLTSGFGIDAFYISENFEETTLVEQDEDLLKIVKHNWKVLGKKAGFINKKLENFILKNQNFNLIYIDPLRRDLNKNKVFLLEDLSPNILEIQKKLLEISDQILIKLSPLIDVSYLVSVLINLQEIHIVAVKNDVKEILVLINNNKKSEKIKIQCVNLESKESVFSFYHQEEALSQYSEPENYLYIPNNAVLKAGMFNLISKNFNLKKLHPNTHLYTSNQYIESFPGRILRIEIITAKSLKKGEKYNIISKNYPLKPEEIRVKYKIKDGGNQYLIFTQTQLGKIILKSV